MGVRLAHCKVLIDYRVISRGSNNNWVGSRESERLYFQLCTTGWNPIGTNISHASKVILQLIYKDKTSLGHYHRRTFLYLFVLFWLVFIRLQATVFDLYKPGQVTCDCLMMLFIAFVTCFLNHSIVIFICTFW